MPDQYVSDLPAIVGTPPDTTKFVAQLPGEPDVVRQATGKQVQDLIRPVIQAAIDALLASAPGQLDTLKELADAIADDPNFAATLSANVAGRVAKAGDTMTGRLALLDAIAAGQAMALGQLSKIGYASVADPVYGAKCDARTYTGVAMSAGSTSIFFPAGHGFTTGAGSPDLNKSVYQLGAGVPRDMVYGGTYLSPTTAQLDKPLLRDIVNVEGAIMQASPNRTTGNYDRLVERRTQISGSFGQTTITDLGGGISGALGSRLAYFIRGTAAETLITHIVDIPDAQHITVADPCVTNVVSGGVLIGTDDTVAIQLCFDVNKNTGKSVLIPTSCICRPVTISGRLRVVSAPGALVYGIFSSANVGTEKLFQITGDYVIIDHVAFDGTYGPVYISNNRYVIYTTGRYTKLISPVITNFMGTEGNPVGGVAGINEVGGVPQVNHLVIHAIYFATCVHWRLKDYFIDQVSGAGLFTSNAVKGRITDGYVGETGWYSCTLDRGADDIVIRGNTFAAVHPVARHWGGPFNAMSQVPGVPNRRIKFINNDVSGTCDYGACLRILSLTDSIISGNQLHDLMPGAFTGGPVQYIAIDTRWGPALGTNGPCKRLRVYNNTLLANGYNNIGVYIKNSDDPEARRGYFDPVEDVRIERNDIISKDADNCFDACIICHGLYAGIKNLYILNNRVVSFCRPVGVSGLPVVLGTIGLVSFADTDTGRLVNITIDGNNVEDIGVSDGSTKRVGLAINSLSDEIDLGKNRWTNYTIGIQTFTGAGPSIYGLNKHRQTFVGCNTEIQATGGNPASYIKTLPYAISETNVGDTVIFQDATGGTLAGPPPGALGDEGWAMAYNQTTDDIPVLLASGTPTTLQGGQLGIWRETNSVVMFFPINPVI